MYLAHSIIGSVIEYRLGHLDIFDRQRTGQMEWMEEIDVFEDLEQR